MGSPVVIPKAVSDIKSLQPQSFQMSRVRSAIKRSSVPVPKVGERGKVQSGNGDLAVLVTDSLCPSYQRLAQEMKFSCVKHICL